MRIVPTLSVVLIGWLFAAAFVYAGDEVAPEVLVAPATTPDEEIVVLCCGFDVSPGYDWTASIAGHTIGLYGWGDATEVLLGGQKIWLPWRAPVVAGALGTSVFLLFVGAAVTLRPCGVAGAEAS